MTAYVLLAYLSKPQVSSADLATASQIVRWLSKQQNPYGGFASTQVPAPGSMGLLQSIPFLYLWLGVTLARCFLHAQDTVVALQALAKYATLTYGSNGDFMVTVTSPTGTMQDFVLHNSNRLVLQRAALHELPGTYGVRARGQGCALVQVGTAWGPRPRAVPARWL